MHEVAGGAGATMSLFSPVYVWTPNQISHRHWRCADCKQNVIKLGDFCMVVPKLWRKLKLTWDDNLCLPCIEKRLGRNLRPKDFPSVQPYVEGYCNSALLSERSGHHKFLVYMDLRRRAEARKKRRARR